MPLLETHPYIPFQDRKIKVFAGMNNESPKINLTDRPNGVQVRCRTSGRDGIAVRCRTHQMNSRILSDILLGCMVVNTHDASHMSGNPCTNLSSTFALPRTKSPPSRPRTHGSSWANRYDTTILKRAWIFCSARFSLTDPPCTRKRGLKPVTKVNRS